LIGRRAINGVITRFTTNAAGFVASLTGAFATIGVSTTGFSLASDFIINFLVEVTFIFDFDANFFTTSDLTAIFGVAFDFSAITHILS